MLIACDTHAVSSVRQRSNYQILYGFYYRDQHYYLGKSTLQDNNNHYYENYYWCYAIPKVLNV